MRTFLACQPICRRGLGDLLAGLGLEVVGMSDGRDDVVGEVRQSRAELALLDVGLPGIDIDRALKDLSRGDPEVRVVFGSHCPGGADVFRALEGAAAGFVALDGSLDELEHDIDRARRGGTAVSARFEHLMMDEIRERHEHAEEKALSPRQAAILECVADGVTTAEIADRLSISPHTVKAHYGGINEKLGVSSKAAAVAEGFRRGLLS